MICTLSIRKGNSRNKIIYSRKNQAELPYWECLPSLDYTWVGGRGVKTVGLEQGWPLTFQQPCFHAFFAPLKSRKKPPRHNPILQMKKLCHREGKYFAQVHSSSRCYSLDQTQAGRLVPRALAVSSSLVLLKGSARKRSFLWAPLCRRLINFSKIQSTWRTREKRQNQAHMCLSLSSADVTNPLEGSEYSPSLDLAVVDQQVYRLALLYACICTYHGGSWSSKIIFSLSNCHKRPNGDTKCVTHWEILS